MNLSKHVVIIPAAGSISDGLMPFSKKKSPLMLDAGGKPLGFRLLDYLLSCGFTRFVLCLRSDDMITKTFLESVFGSRASLHFVSPEKNLGVGFTILSGLESVIHTSSIEGVLIVLGDTLFEFADKNQAMLTHSFVMAQDLENEDSSRWCIAETDEKGRVTKFLDKVANYSGDGKILTGIYGLANAQLLYKNLVEATRNVENCREEILQNTSNQQLQSSVSEKLPVVELSSVLELYRKDEEIICEKAHSWYDFGNIDLLIQSRKKILKQRAFNALIIDTDRGIITKSSADNPEKLIDEIQYLSLLPDELQAYFPRVIKSEVYTDVPSISMEYYGYPTLSEYFVFEQLHPSLWQVIFEHLRFAIHDFSRFQPKLKKNNISNYYTEMYRTRISSRLETIGQENWEVSKIARAKSIVVNGESLKIWQDIENQIFTLVEELARIEDFGVIHGDLCFPNILCDISSDIVKFIDPRGSFGTKGIFGDVKYDVAKIYHSVHGGYDFIVNDLFSLGIIENTNAFEINFSIFNYNSYVQDVFQKVFFGEGKWNEIEIKLIEGLLFLTMPVFHYDNPRRQVAMYIRGLQILNEVVDKQGK